MNNNNIKFFVFSLTQFKMRRDIEAKLGRTYKPGEVLVNGVYKQYTEILNDPKESRYPDAIIIASGDIRYIKYKK